MSCETWLGSQKLATLNALKIKKNAVMKFSSKRRGGFTLVEIMIVVAIIALLAAIAVPGFLRARKRAQATRILNDLRMIDSAVDQYAVETNKSSGSTVAVTDWTNYVKKDTLIYASGQDLYGDTYGPQTVDQLPKCPANAWNTLSDVADTSFFSPYGHL
jgi:prepilin-type N-terminal cleavage/methylation domain-containing protein